MKEEITKIKIRGKEIIVKSIVAKELSEEGATNVAKYLISKGVYKEPKQNKK
ncbi:hypothetical protein V7111_19370 [Neobacillus niacini]|uniref:hypothetical protein n=1 Tax=Neobacillus niacini TaxID=86668 RepID=UPI0030021061